MIFQIWARTNDVAEGDVVGEPEVLAGLDELAVPGRVSKGEQ